MDFVGDFSVERNGIRHVWNAEHPCWTRLEYVQIGGVSVPIYSMEDLLLVYLALPGEEAKLTLIARSLRQRGVDWAYLHRIFLLWPSMEDPVRFWLTRAL